MDSDRMKKSNSDDGEWRKIIKWFSLYSIELTIYSFINKRQVKREDKKKKIQHKKNEKLFFFCLL